MFGQMKQLWHDKPFLRSTLKVMLPSAFQSLLFLLVNLIDVFTINMALGGNQSIDINLAVQAVSIVSTIFGLNFVLINAICVSGNVYAGQYMGDKKYSLVKETTRYKILVSFAISIIFVAFLMGFKKEILGLFISGDAAGDAVANNAANQIITFASSYLDYAVFSFILVSISVPFAYTMTATGNPFVPLIASGVAVFVNLVLTIIFGLSFSNFASMGMSGHGLSTVIARICELMVLIVYVILKNPIYAPGWKIFNISKKIWCQITRTLIFVIISEFLYQIYEILLLLILVWLATSNHGYNGMQIAAGTNAINLSTTIIQLFYAFLCGCTITLPYLVGSELGLKNYKKAVSNANYLITIMYFLAAIMSVVIMILAVLLSFFLVDNKSENYRITTLTSIIGCGIGFFFYGIAFFKFNVLRNGGRQLVASLCDTLPYYVCYLLLEIILFSCGVQIWIVLLVIPLTQIVQYILGIIVMKKVAWAQSIIKKNRSVKPFKVVKREEPVKKDDIVKGDEAHMNIIDAEAKISPLASEIVNSSDQT